MKDYLKYEVTEWKDINSVLKGEVLQTEKDLYIFLKILRGSKHFYGISLTEEKIYRISLHENEKFCVVGKSLQENPEKIEDDRNLLQEGDLFVIKRKKGVCELYRFNKITFWGKIQAINHLTGKKYCLDEHFIYVKFDRILY